MSVEALVTAIIGFAGVAGSFMAGKRSATSQAVGIAVDTVELLKTQVESLVEQNHLKDTQIGELHMRIDILEGLVTQRAEVEAVKNEVTGVRGVVDRIAIKVGA